jgi:hypothetical protein
MPRDGNGNYTLPLPPVVADTTIESVHENSTNSDLAQALTDSLSRGGSGGMTTQLGVVDGNTADPGLKFISETQSGFYRASAGDVRCTLLAADQWRVTATGFQYWDHGTSMWATPVSQVELSDLDGAVVKIAGAQTITGAKTFNAVLTMGGVKITGLADGVDPQDAVSKAQLDAQDAGNVKLTGNQSIDGIKTFIASSLNMTRAGALTFKLERTDGTPGTAALQVSGSHSRLSLQDTTAQIHDLETGPVDRLNFKYDGVTHSYWDGGDGGWDFISNSLTTTGDLRANHGAFGALATTSAYGELAVREAAGDNANLALLAGAAGAETADFRATAQGSTGDVLLQSLQGELILTSTVDSIQLNAFNTSVARFNPTQVDFNTADIYQNAGIAWADLHLVSTNADPLIGGRLYAENGANDMAMEMSPGPGGAFTFIVGGAARGRFRDNGLLQVVGLAGTGNRAVYSDPTGNLTNVASDARLKESVWTSEYGLSEVLEMNPITYRWKDKSKGEQTELGFIAQDMQKLVPEVVGENADGMLSLDYPKLVAVMAKAIQELTARVEELENG